MVLAQIHLGHVSAGVMGTAFPRISMRKRPLLAQQLQYVFSLLLLYRY